MVAADDFVDDDEGDDDGDDSILSPRILLILFCGILRTAPASYSKLFSDLCI